MKYFVDSQLIAVGVVDILPEGLSQVLFFYDPSYKKLRLGVIGQLQEIKLVLEFNKLFPSFRYYYMGKC
jgi:arginine-tRNA-protein transferase